MNLRILLGMMGQRNSLRASGSHFGNRRGWGRNYRKKSRKINGKKTGSLLGLLRSWIKPSQKLASSLHFSVTWAKTFPLFLSYFESCLFVYVNKTKVWKYPFLYESILTNIYKWCLPHNRYLIHICKMRKWLNSYTTLKFQWRLKISLFYLYLNND